MAGGQQGGAGAVSLAAGADGEDGQVLVGYAGRVVGFQRRVERLEPPGQRAGDGGQPRVIAVGRAWRGGAGGQP